MDTVVLNRYTELFPQLRLHVRGYLVLMHRILGRIFREWKISVSPGAKSRRVHRDIELLEPHACNTYSGNPALPERSVVVVVLGIRWLCTAKHVAVRRPWLSMFGPICIEDVLDYPNNLIPAAACGGTLISLPANGY